MSVKPWLISLFLASALAADAKPPQTAPSTQPQIIEQRIPRTVVSFKMVKIPAGSIEMPRLRDGEKPRTVQIKSFWIGQTELTWDEYETFWIGDWTDDERQYILSKLGPSKTLYGIDYQGFGHSGYPAICITSDAAQVYCGWLSKRTGRKYRLATEAEWEYACRAGGAPEVIVDIEAYAKQLADIAWFRDNSETDAGDPATHEVAKKRPNAWGLYDMLGNVCEWVINADGAPVVKGGSFKFSAKLVTSRARQPYSPNWQVRDPRMPKWKWWLTDGPHVGFRIVMEE